MTRRLAIALTAAFFCAPALAAGRHAVPVTVEGVPQTAADRTIVMVGQGSVTAMPDTAVVYGGVVTRARDAGDALRANNQAMAKVLAALKAMGIVDKQITTSNVSFQPVHPPYDPKTGQSDKIIGYQVTNSINVKLSDLAKSGDVLDAMIENGADQFATIGFEIKDRDALEAKAREAAGRDALKRAQAYATALGTELGQVRSVHEGDMMPMDVETVSVTGARAMAAPPPPPSMAVAPGEQTISATVTVVWALK